MIYDYQSMNKARPTEQKGEWAQINGSSLSKVLMVFTTSTALGEEQLAVPSASTHDFSVERCPPRDKA